MNDINLVLRNKRVQLAELALEIEGLAAAAMALRPVAHLLYAEEEPPTPNSAQISISENSSAEVAKARTPENSRIRRWV
jgi:hypothetical protein